MPLTTTATGIWLQHKNCKATRMQISTATTTTRLLPASRTRTTTMATTTADKRLRLPCGRKNGQTSGCICLMNMLPMLLLALVLVPDVIVALKDVSVMIPQAVKRGSNALLTCNYDMENDTLYSVKWYKGKREFYRYTPKENPAMKVFAMTSGLNVERNLSNQSHVVLQSVPLNISGKFTCEISVEAPTFQTAMVSGEMEVVELPEEHTVVTGIQARYRIGDLVDGNCSIKYSKPAANLTWTINGIVVPPHHIKTYQIEKHENSSLESVMSAIHFMVTTQHFLKGQMRLKCTANIFDIFKEEIESIIEEDRPRIMASGRSYDMNNYPLDEHTNGERGFEDHNESYLTYYSADGSASGATTAANEVFWHSWLWKLKQTMRRTKMLQEYINRQLRAIPYGIDSIGSKFDVFAVWRWQWQWQQFSLGFSWAGSIIAGLAAATATFCLLAHQIIDCQHCSSGSSGSSGSELGDSKKTAASNDANVTMTMTMTKAMPATSSKCFYNCQMATATATTTATTDAAIMLCTLQHKQQQQQSMAKVNVAYKLDEGNDDASGVPLVVGNIECASNDAATTTTATTGTATVAKQRQQLSATVASVWPRLDQRLLMTWWRHQVAATTAAAPKEVATAETVKVSGTISC